MNACKSIDYVITTLKSENRSQEYIRATPIKYKRYILEKDFYYG